MGDRSNIILRSDGEQVVLYGHWMGTEYIPILQAALIRAGQRKDDFQYLARVVFCEMIKDDVMGTDGFGISQNTYDANYPDLCVDVDNQTVSFNNVNPVNLTDFISNPSIVGDPNELH
jgi:hypothetical protein